MICNRWVSGHLCCEPYLWGKSFSFLSVCVMLVVFQIWSLLYWGFFLLSPFYWEFFKNHKLMVNLVKCLLFIHWYDYMHFIFYRCGRLHLLICICRTILPSLEWWHMILFSLLTFHWGLLYLFYQGNWFVVFYFFVELWCFLLSE